MGGRSGEGSMRRQYLDGTAKRKQECELTVGFCNRPRMSAARTSKTAKSDIRMVLGTIYRVAEEVGSFCIPIGKTI